MAVRLRRPPLTLGFRGSTFDTMLMLRPDAGGEYTEATFLSAGGVRGTTPGTYLGSATAALTTIDTANGDAFASRATGSMHGPRVFGYGTMLPTGQVVATSGGNRDHVVAPGSERPVRTVEQYDPETGRWSEMVSEERPRTYHTNAILLPDARVLVGGHAPIGTGYAAPTDAGEAIGLGNPNGDPTFQVFSPPYLHWGERPVITDVDPDVRTGEVLDVAVEDPSDISSVRLLRNTSTTHSVDPDQRNVELAVVGRDADSVQVQVPANRAVLPPGPYHLFAHRAVEQGEIPSVSRQVFVNSSLPADRIDEITTSADEWTGQVAAVQPAPAGSAPAGPAPDGAPAPGGGPVGFTLPLAGAVVGFGGLLATGGHRSRRTERKDRRSTA